MRINNLVIKPVVTEKTIKLADLGKYVFLVNLSSNDGEVIKAIKTLYNVDPLWVNSAVMPGKRLRKGKTQKFKKTPKTKKVYVQLKEGQKIDIMPKE